MSDELRSDGEDPILLTHLDEVSRAEVASFHMPGHKGGAGAPPRGLALWGPAVYATDLSELSGFDYLHGPTSALAVAQRRAAGVFGAARSWYLVNGATVGNIASIASVVGDGESLLVARDSHRSVYAGIALSGAWPHYLRPVDNAGLGGPFGLDPADVEAALDAHREIRAVHITSPSYYGFVVDVAAIAAIAHRHGVPLIVDEAHGAHFCFHPDLPDSALRSGADLVIQSPHKTLGSLTQSSLLHAGGTRVDLARLDATLSMLQSSSPSALLLVSLDLAIAEMAEHGAARWGRAIDLANSARRALSGASGVRAYGEEVTAYRGIAGFDPTKLVVDVDDLGTTGYAAARVLAGSAHLNPEFADLRRMVFSVTIADDAPAIALLLEALAALAATGLAPRRERGPAAWPEATPEMVCSPRVGARAPRTTVAIGEAVGRVSAEMIVPYPPGVPLVVAGEAITAEVTATIRQVLGEGGRIVGMTDPTGATLSCIA
jgi:arginine/lysine/ornithine decarboxylase